MHSSLLFLSLQLLDGRVSTSLAFSSFSIFEFLACFIRVSSRAFDPASKGASLLLVTRYVIAFATIVTVREIREEED